MPSEFSFCESVTATGSSSWHIRKLSPVGRKLGGGVDTPSLCGHVKPSFGWDLNVNINSASLRNACQRCKYLYREEPEVQPKPLPAMKRFWRRLIGRG